MIDKKEIKRNYKETLPPMGIFVFRNLMSGKILLGKSMNLPGKKNAIEFQLKMGSHMNRNLQEDYKKEGLESFAFEVIDELEPKEGVDYDYSDDLTALMDLWVEKYELTELNSYNTIKTNPDGSKIIR